MLFFSLNTYQVCWNLIFYQQKKERIPGFLVHSHNIFATIQRPSAIASSQAAQRSAGLLTACYRSTCLQIWLASLDFIPLPFRSICTSSASLLVQWKMQNFMGKKKQTLVTKCYWKKMSLGDLYVAELLTVCLMTDHVWETQTAVVWSCLPFIRSGQNHLARHSERGKKTRPTKKEVGRQHQGMDRPGVRQVPEGSGEQGKMEKTGCEIICGAPTTLAVKGLMMMMMMMMMMMFADKTRP